MAYTLKSTGLATNLVMCLAVDQDGTIKEFVNSTVNSNKSLGTGVAASVATGEWKGVARKYWSSAANGSFDYFGVTFPSSPGGARPSLATNNTAGITLWEAYHAALGAGATGHYWHYGPSGGSDGPRRSSGKLANYMNGVDRGAGTTTLPSDGTTKFSAGYTFRDATGVGAKFYYGLESGSLAADGTSTSGVGFGSSSGVVLGVGGAAGQGRTPASRYCTLLFNTELTLSQMESLHDDWFGTLFDAPASSPVVKIMQMLMA